VRISKTMSDTIVKYVNMSFGDSNIYLFGSRVDDSKVGGDIDIAVENSDSRLAFRKKKAVFFTMMYKHGFDIKIDLVQYEKSSDKLINREIELNSVLLNNEL